MTEYEIEVTKSLLLEFFKGKAWKLNGKIYVDLRDVAYLIKEHYILKTEEINYD